MSDWPHHLPADGYTRRMATDAIVLHHTATRPEATVRAMRRHHQLRGWIDIGYHFLVRLGTVELGRPAWAVGAHAPGWNSRSIGVALVGDYAPDRPPPATQLHPLCELVLRLLVDYPGARLLDHRQAMAEVGEPNHTTCPGVDLADLVRERLP